MILIEGHEYTAFYLGDHMWLVRKFTLGEKNSVYLECLLRLKDVATEKEAIEASIAQRSWA